MEYYTSEDEAEASKMDQPPRVGSQRRRVHDEEQEEEDSLICFNCGALGDVLEEGGDHSEFR